MSPPALSLDDPVLEMRLHGGGLALTALAFLVGVVLGVVRNGLIPLVVRIVYGAALLGFSAVLVLGSMATLEAPYFGSITNSFATAEALRATLFISAGLIALSAALSEVVRARRPTRR